MKSSTDDQDIQAWNNLGEGVKIDKSGYVIEKNVPIPKAIPPSKWTFTEAMGIGDSIVVEASEKGKVGSYMRGKSMKVITRKISDDKVRVWRAG